MFYQDYYNLVFVAPNGIPSNTYTIEIAQNQIGVLTCGPVRINDINLTGGSNPDRALNNLKDFFIN